MQFDIWFNTYTLYMSNYALFPWFIVTKLLFKYIQPCDELSNNLNPIVTVVVDEEL